MRLWYLSHRRPAKAQVSLRFRADSPEPSLFAHMKYGSRRRGRPKIRYLATPDGCTCAFEHEFTEDEKYHNLMRWLNYRYCKTLYFHVFSISRFCDLRLFLQRFKFAMHYIFLCKLYIRKHFERMLNLRAIKFANISENKVLANNNEFTDKPRQIV